jgi:hypothetical protein
MAKRAANTPPAGVQIPIRAPIDLRAQLRAEAARQGVSMNSLIVALLSGGLASLQAGTGFKLPEDWLDTPITNRK